MYSRGLPRLGLLGSLLVLAALLSGCSARETQPTPPSRPPAAQTEPAEASVLAEEIEKLQRELTASDEESERLQNLLNARDEEIARLREEVGLLDRRRVELEEENASLELELVITLEELLRVQANLKNVQSRAFAVSRIAEVRVQLEALRRQEDPALTDRLDRADDFLDRADDAFGKGNAGGAAFLAERAGELVRQCKTIAELRSVESKDVVPIVPQREVQVLAAANLRHGPDTDAERVDTVPAGTRLQAIGRLGDWFRVRTESGKTVWIHGSLVE